MADALVVGGAGFIGRSLVSLLTGRGQRVRIVSRSVEPGVRNGIEYMRGTVADPEGMRKAVQGVRDVYHLGAGGGDRWSDFERDFIHSSRHLVAIGRECGVRRVLFTSTIATLFLGGSDPVTDATPCDPQPLKRGVYSRAKGAAEQVFNEAYAKDKFPVVIVRPAVVLGPGGQLDHAGFGTWASDLCCIGWGNGDNPLPLVLGSDVAAAMMAAMDTPGIEGRTFNLAGDVRLTAREYVDELSHRARRNHRFYPRSVSRLMAVDIAKWMIKVAARKPENPFPDDRDIRSRTLRAPLDCSGAKTVLGWKPMTNREEFCRQIIDANIRPIPPGDHRRPRRTA